MNLEELIAEKTAERVEKLLGERFSSDRPLYMEDLRDEYRMSRESLASAQHQGLSVHRGARGRLVVYRRDLDAWIKSREWIAPDKSATPASDMADAHEAAARALGVAS